MTMQHHPHTANDTGHKRRKKFLIRAAFQWKFAGFVMLGTFAASVLAGVLLFGVLHGQARLRVIDPGSPVVWESALVVIGAGLGFAVLTAGAVGLCSVIYTHRICGPLYVVGQLLEELRSGRCPRPRRLRRKDEFKDLYATLCGTIESLRSRSRQQQIVLMEIVRLARDAGEMGDMDTAVRDKIVQRAQALLRDSDLFLDGSAPAEVDTGSCAAVASDAPVLA